MKAEVYNSCDHNNSKNQFSCLPDVSINLTPYALLSSCAWVPIFLLITAIPAASFFIPEKSYENTALLLILNFVCSFCTSLLIIFLLARAFLMQGSPGLLLLASGVLFWGVAGLIGVITGIAGGSTLEFANTVITIHNCSVFLSSVLHLAGIVFLIQPVKISSNRSVAVGLAFFIVLLISGIISISANHGWIPPFFIQQSGGTWLRQCILNSSIAMYILTSVIMLLYDRRSGSFMYWYALALVLVAVGLFGVMIQSVSGGIVGWLGRSAQFLSGPYLLVAAIQSFREARLKGTPLDETLIGWKRIKEVLRESQEQFKMAALSTDIGIWECDLMSRGVKCDEKVRNLFGVEPDEMITYETFINVTIPEDRIIVQTALERSQREASDGLLEFEFRVVNKITDVLRWVAVTGRTWFSNGQPDRIIGITRDITEKKVSEEILRQSEEKYRLLFTNTFNGMAFHEIITDQQGNVFDYRFVDVNQAFERMTGLKAVSIIGKTVREVLPGIENDPVDWIGKYGRVALRGEQICFEEFSHKLKKWYHVTAFQTTPGRFGTIFEDITIRKEHEQQLAFNLDAMTRLQKMGELLIHAGNQDIVLSEILDTAIAISGADFGNIQMTDSSGDLQIVAQRGFPQWWLDFWQSESRVKGICGTALERGERVIVEDVEQSPIFKGTPALEVQLKAGVRAVFTEPLFNRSGTPVGVISIHYRKPYCPDDRILRMIDLLARQAADIIEHTKDTEALRCSEERFRALAVASSNIVFRMSPDWDKMEQLRGVDFLSEVEKPDIDWLRKYIPVQEQPRVITAIKEAVSTRSVLELEHRVLKSDGSTGWAHSKAIPLIDINANVYEWFGTASDITDRKKALEALQQSESLLRAVTDNNRDPIFLKDRNSRLIFANPATLKLIGKSAEKVMGKTDEEFYDNPSDGRTIMENDRRIIESGCDEVFEETISGSDGSFRTYISSKTPWYNEYGQIIGIVGMSHEITERKQAELALQHRTEELHAANKELESFSYSVSHDLRSQLNSIKCLSQVLLEKYLNDFSDDVADFIRKISSSTDKMAQIINGMLNLARLTRESMTCHLIDLVPIINAVFYELKQTDPNREVEICIDPELTAYADARLMHIALTNLIENAWKYSSKNPHARIEIGTQAMGDEKVFFIRDNGAGFNMKHADKLFEPFQRLHSENHFPGTGIGLATVSKIIHRHGGKIWAESFVGEGATFYFTTSLQYHDAKTVVTKTFDETENIKELDFEQLCKN